MRTVKITVFNKEIFECTDSLGFLNELEIGVKSNILGSFGKGRNCLELESQPGIITNETEDDRREVFHSIAV